MGERKSSKRRNETFFNDIYSEYYELVYNTIKKILYSKIDDDITSCAQDTFMKVWANIEMLKKHEKIAGWLVVAAKHTAGNFNKKHNIRKKVMLDDVEIDEIPDNTDFTQDIAETAKFEKFIKSDIAGKFINQLSESERNFYELKYIQKLSNEEIGQILEITPNSVVVRGRRMIDKFKKELLNLKK